VERGVAAELAARHGGPRSLTDGYVLRPSACDLPNVDRVATGLCLVAGVPLVVSITDVRGSRAAMVVAVPEGPCGARLGCAAP
jgi:hypothetical protein